VRKIQYDPSALRADIERCDKEIILFQTEIEKKIKEKAQLQMFLAEAELQQKE